MDSKDKLLAVLSYLGILALVPILWKNKSAYLKSHSDNGVVILLSWVLLLFVFQIPFVGVLLGILLLIATLVFTVWGIVDASTNRDAKIPGLEKVVHLIA